MIQVCNQYLKYNKMVCNQRYRYYIQFFYGRRCLPWVYIYILFAVYLRQSCKCFEIFFLMVAKILAWQGATLKCYQWKH